MKKCYQLIIIVLLLSVLSSCEQYFYIPNAHNVPLFQEKGEIRAWGTLNKRKYPNEYQAAYALTNHIGLMANVFVVPFDSDTPTYNDGSGYLIEGGAGYFTKINKHGVFESYGGYGAGNVKNIYFDSRPYGWFGTEYIYAGHSIMNINRVFLQPSIGYTSKYFDCALSTRFSGIWYTNIRTYDVPEDFFYAKDMELMRKNVFTQFEPAITVRGGWKYIKLQTQLGFSMNMNNKPFRYVDGNLNVGVYLSFAEKFRHKNVKTPGKKYKLGSPLRN